MTFSVRPRRLLLKISGEMLLGQQSFGVSHEAAFQLASSLKRMQQMDLELAVVIGGGNICRGVDVKKWGIPRTPADHMGMVATLFNGIALKQALLLQGVKTVLMSAVECPLIAESYNWDRAMDHLQQKTVVLFAGGTGVPYFTTDTAAALRAGEMGAHLLLKATKVDGIYSADPFKEKEAMKYSQISYAEVLAKKLKVMDATAVALCQTSQIPIFIFKMEKLYEQQLQSVLFDYSHGSIICGE